MTLPRWDEEMKFELLRLRSELRPENFKVLHAPIGLGRPTKVTIDTKRFPHLQNAPLPQATSDSYISAPMTMSRQNPAEVPLSDVEPLPPLPLVDKESHVSSRLLKIILVHALDLAFVIVTLGLGLLVASWVIDPSHVTENPEILAQATPVHALLKTRAIVILLGVYAFFSLYWLFFKLVSGTTLAESFLENFSSLQNPRKGRSIKDSGDS